jgi:hypothetical protein
MAQYRTSRTFDVFFIVFLLGLLYIGYLNKIVIMDWVYFSRYHPSAQTTQFADDAGLNAWGKKLFYRTNPAFVTMDEIVAKCDVERLGCLDEKGNSFILDTMNEHDQAVATAAHEMLHLAYRRLPQKVKDEIGPWIDQAIEQNGTAITDELRDMKSEDDRRDEAHSLLGTEYRVMPQELKEYYDKYFADREKVVAASDRSLQ